MVRSDRGGFRRRPYLPGLETIAYPRFPTGPKIKMAEPPKWPCSMNGNERGCVRFDRPPKIHARPTYYYAPIAYAVESLFSLPYRLSQSLISFFFETREFLDFSLHDVINYTRMNEQVFLKYWVLLLLLCANMRWNRFFRFPID